MRFETWPPIFPRKRLKESPVCAPWWPGELLRVRRENVYIVDKIIAYGGVSCVRFGENWFVLNEHSDPAVTGHVAWPSGTFIYRHRSVRCKITRTHRRPVQVRGQLDVVLKCISFHNVHEPLTTHTYMNVYIFWANNPPVLLQIHGRQ